MLFFAQQTSGEQPEPATFASREPVRQRFAGSPIVGHGILLGNDRPPVLNSAFRAFIVTTARSSCTSAPTYSGISGSSPATGRERGGMRGVYTDRTFFPNPGLRRGESPLQTGPVLCSRRVEAAIWRSDP